MRTRVRTARPVTDRRRAPPNERELVVRTGAKSSPRSIVLHIHLEEEREEEEHVRPVLTGLLWNWKEHYHPIIVRHLDRPDDTVRRHVWTKRAAIAVAALAWTFVIWRAFLSI